MGGPANDILGYGTSSINSTIKIKDGPDIAKTDDKEFILTLGGAVSSVTFGGVGVGGKLLMGTVNDKRSCEETARVFSENNNNREHYSSEHNGVITCKIPLKHLGAVVINA